MLRVYKKTETLGERVEFPNSTLPAQLYSFEYDCKRMGNAPTITGTIMYPLCLDNYWNEDVYVEFKGEKYYIENTPSSSYSNQDARYKHEIIFVSERKKLEKIYFKDILNIGNKKANTDFSFFGDLSVFVAKLNDCMGTFNDNTGYYVVIDPDIKTEEKNIVIENMYILEALQYAVEEYGVPYYIQGKKIHFGECQNEISTPLKYGVDNALLSIHRDNANEVIINRITGVGSSENIPYYYPNFNESGEHDVTTDPTGYADDISKLNYLKIDPYTRLRDGGYAQYYKACVNPIGNDFDEVSIQVLSISNSSPIQGEFYEWKQNITAPDVDGTIYAQKEVFIDVYIKPSIKSDFTISNILIARPDYGTIDYEQELEVLSIKGKYMPSGDGSFLPVEGNVDYDVTDNQILVTPSILYKFGITISLKANVKFPVNKAGSVLAYFNYNTKYSTSLSNTTVKSANGNIDEKVYLDFNKVIDYPNGIKTYTETLTYKVTREVAGYSNAKLDSVFRGVFLNNEGDDMSEWKRFIPNSIVVKNSKGDTISHYVDTSYYINFRNTSNARDIFTIEMSVRVQMSTDSRDTAYRVELEYIPDFGRIEKTYDYWKFHDGDEVKYSIAGIKFDNTSAIPDGLKVIFSPTINWIDPKQYLMPSKYRQTLGEDIFYEANNNTYRDDKGLFITFPNPYSSIKKSELVAEPKEDIKPTIVGVRNARGERIDMFADIAFDKNDNNDRWEEVDENTEELVHSFFFVKLRKTDGIDGFNLFEQSIENGEMTISMTTGHCGSCNFVIAVDEETQKNLVQVDENGDLVRDDEGNVRLGSPQDKQQDTQNNEVWIALRKSEDDYGIILPDKAGGIVPTTDDKFVITNILLPNQYITKAEERLEKELLAEMLDKNDEKFEYNIDLSRIFLAENEDIANNLNENSVVIIQYNDVNYRMYVSSYSYKMDSNTTLPNIKIEITKELTITKNKLQVLEDKVFKKVEYISSLNNLNTANERGSGGISNITVVQETGYDTKKVMSQKAVTKAVEKVAYDNQPTPISQNIGHSTTSVMSQKAVTMELIALEKSFNNKVLQTTGGMTNKWLSQKAVTDALTLAKPTFDGIETSVKYVIATSPYESYDGSVVYISSDKHFAYKAGINYYRDWHSSSMYNTTAPKALTNTVFKNTSDNQDYIFDGTDLVLLTSGGSGTGTMMTELSYSELKSLYDGTNLTKGMQYRITDYVTTCNSAGSVSGATTSSANHQFDIIVTADTNSALNANARVCLHEGDTYFADYKLNEWVIKYDINNDTNKYQWADTTNGKGVIYYMKDEFDNECAYDFKNIKFNNNYTFNLSNSTDHSLNGAYCYENKIKGYYDGVKLILNNVVFNTSSAITSCKQNALDVNCHSNTMGNGCNNITFGNNCNSNTLDRTLSNISFGNGCVGNTIPKMYYVNVRFDNSCSYIQLNPLNTTNSTDRVRNIHIKSGVGGTSDNILNISVPTSTTNLTSQTIVAKNSSGVIKIYCEADLVG